MLALLKNHGIELVNGRARRPQTQGLVEQGNSTVKARLAKWKRSTGSTAWSNALPDIMVSINSTVHQATGKTPFEVVFGRKSTVKPWLSPKQCESLLVEIEQMLERSD